MSEGESPLTMIPGMSQAGTGALSAHADDAIYEFLAFRLGEETYALPLAGVQEILKPPPVTVVPRAPSDVLGIISVRGRVTTVIDLRRRLKLAEAPTDSQTRILLVAAGDEVVGLVVDAVSQVYRLYEDEVEIASTVSSDMADYLLGIGRPRAVRTLGRSSSQNRGEDADILILLNAEPLLNR